MNSLKFFTIKESIYNLTYEEKKELIKEIFSNLSKEEKTNSLKNELINISTNEIYKIKEECKNLVHNRYTKAKKNYQEQFFQLINLPEYGRDYSFNYPDEGNFCIKWNPFLFPASKNKENEIYKCRYELKLNKNIFKIEKILLCSCFSNIGCYGCNEDLDKEKINGLLVEGEIKNEKLEYIINEKFIRKTCESVSIENYSEKIIEWVRIVLKVYFPVMLNYEKLKEEYYKTIFL